MKKIAELILSSKTIGLVTHKDNDGDAFGSMFALSRALEQNGKNTVIFSNEKINGIFNFLEEKVKYTPVEKYEKTDLLIGLDANDAKRFMIPDLMENSINDEVKVAIIDHHMAGSIKDVATAYWQADGQCSTSEMVFDLLKYMGLKIDKITANFILLGIETDTMSLQFENTKPKTYETMAELLRLGARLKPVTDSAFGGKSVGQLKILGRAIDRLSVDKNGWAKTYITLKDIYELKLDSNMTSGISNFLEQADGIQVIAVFQEKEDGLTKVSLRSNKSYTDVEKIAKNFEGGGHVKAAGYEFDGNIDKAMKALENYIQ